jgi:hypothetical protein
VEVLNRAIQALESIDFEAEELADRIQKRRQGVQAWMAIFRQLERSVDPDFDAADVPAVNIVPPTANGITYPSGVDPKAIPDPKAQSQYQEELNKNRQKAERYQVQDGFRKLGQRAEFALQTLVQRTYSGTKSDRDELHNLIREGGLSEKRREMLERELR